MANQDVQIAEENRLEDSSEWQTRSRYRVYQPTPDEIRKQCLALQQAWSHRERKRRRVHDGDDEHPRPFVEIKVIRAPSGRDSFGYE